MRVRCHSSCGSGAGLASHGRQTCVNPTENIFCIGSVVIAPRLMGGLYVAVLWDSADLCTLPVRKLIAISPWRDREPGCAALRQGPTASRPAVGAHRMSDHAKLRILGIAGSLRRASYNAASLRA